ncbi:hypothetical protein CCACVL1_24059 [Corchorus capsularis]|uniref:Uncharacterized protein n=1 Tax=Corchorus capsularis TaxID=210143 RepID=A0A1R3GR08_COCAP|nr:hypothetical protein CCACVL1_24059 [Corchorus capsularis]
METKPESERISAALRSVWDGRGAESGRRERRTKARRNLVAIVGGFLKVVCRVCCRARVSVIVRVRRNIKRRLVLAGRFRHVEETYWEYWNENENSLRRS